MGQGVFNGLLWLTCQFSGLAVNTYIAHELLTCLACLACWCIWLAMTAAASAQALALLEIMWEGGEDVQPDVVTYNSVLKALGNAGRLDFAMRLFQVWTNVCVTHTTFVCIVDNFDRQTSPLFSRTCAAEASSPPSRPTAPCWRLQQTAGTCRC